ncbi:hypothetical protein RN001_016208 [Aquatica leii]|uniref:Uncharacterized protein n=1 Tax=Aquatica leii TaxID=1421715 RepID=A0AAN7SB82_9COLE|nr:hypothetical protein RN001_016208 [Aquatica leii]
MGTGKTNECSHLNYLHLQPAIKDIAANKSYDDIDVIIIPPDFDFQTDEEEFDDKMTQEDLSVPADVAGKIEVHFGKEDETSDEEDNIPLSVLQKTLHSEGVGAKRRKLDDSKCKKKIRKNNEKVDEKDSETEGETDESVEFMESSDEERNLANLHYMEQKQNNIEESHTINDNTKLLKDSFVLPNSSPELKLLVAAIVSFLEIATVPSAAEFKTCSLFTFKMSGFLGKTNKGTEPKGCKNVTSTSKIPKHSKNNEEKLKISSMDKVYVRDPHKLTGTKLNEFREQEGSDDDSVSDEDICVSEHNKDSELDVEEFSDESVEVDLTDKEVLREPSFVGKYKKTIWCKHPVRLISMDPKTFYGRREYTRLEHAVEDIISQEFNEDEDLEICILPPPVDELTDLEEFDDDILLDVDDIPVDIPGSVEISSEHEHEEDKENLRPSEKPGASDSPSYGNCKITKWSKRHPKYNKFGTNDSCFTTEFESVKIDLKDS